MLLRDSDVLRHGNGTFICLIWVFRGKFPWKTRLTTLFRPFHFPAMQHPQPLVGAGPAASCQWVEEQRAWLLSAFRVRAPAGKSPGLVEGFTATPRCSPWQGSRAKGSWRGGTQMCCNRLLSADIRAPKGLPASQRSVSRPGVGYETRKWLGATFVPPLVAPLLCPWVEDLGELGWKQQLAKNPWGWERHFRQW